MTKEINEVFLDTEIADLHTHILPKMDDGSSSFKETVEILNECEKQKIKKIVFTPHFYPKDEDIDHFIKRRESSINRVLEKDNINIGLYKGAEVFFFLGIAHIKDTKKLCINGTNYLLLEMPFDKWNEMFVDEVIKIKDSLEVIPILAHIERYIKLGNLKHILSLKKYGILTQVNANFFIKKSTKKKALKMLKKGYIDLISSDTHNVSDRKENLGEAINIINNFDSSLIKTLENNSSSILKNAKIINS